LSVLDLREKKALFLLMKKGRNRGKEKRSGFPYMQEGKKFPVALKGRFKCNGRERDSPKGGEGVELPFIKGVRSN